MTVVCDMVCSTERKRSLDRYNGITACTVHHQPVPDHLEDLATGLLLPRRRRVGRSLFGRTNISAAVRVTGIVETGWENKTA